MLSLFFVGWHKCQDKNMRFYIYKFKSRSSRIWISCKNSSHSNPLMAIYTYKFFKILLKYLSNASQKFSRLFLMSHSPKASPIIFQPKHVTETSSPMTLSPLWPHFCFHLDFKTIQNSWPLHFPSSEHPLLFNLPYTQFSFSSLKDLSEGSSSLTQSQNVTLNAELFQAPGLRP